MKILKRIIAIFGYSLASSLQAIPRMVHDI